MENNPRKVSSVMKPYIIFVLQRDEIPYICCKEKNCYYFFMSISNRRFTEVLEDALCEKQRENYISRTPVYSYRTLMNRQKLHRLQTLNKRKGYHVLKADEKRYFATYNK